MGPVRSAPRRYPLGHGDSPRLNPSEALEGVLGVMLWLREIEFDTDEFDGGVVEEVGRGGLAAGSAVGSQLLVELIEEGLADPDDSSLFAQRSSWGRSVPFLEEASAPVADSAEELGGDLGQIRHDAVVEELGSRVGTEQLGFLGRNDLARLHCLSQSEWHRVGGRAPWGTARILRKRLIS